MGAKQVIVTRTTVRKKASSSKKGTRKGQKRCPNCGKFMK